MGERKADFLQIKKASEADLQEVTRLYETLITYLDSKEINYPKWEKGIYPSEESAARAIAEGTLYLACAAGRVLGSLVINRVPEPAYRNAKWLVETSYRGEHYENVAVLHTLAISPDAMESGVATSLLAFAEELAQSEGLDSLRLDLVLGNEPAKKLYQKCGYSYIDTISMGYEAQGIPFFELYEKPLQPGRKRE